MCRIIFLDVDGVLNNLDWAKRMKEEEDVSVFRENILEKRALLLLKRLVESADARIVVSSAWRKIPSAYKDLLSQLDQYGMKVFDKTPYVGGDRGNDITAWFKRHPGKYSYAILDDDSDMTVHMDHLVQTSFYHRGLTGEHVDRCIELLKRDPIDPLEPQIEPDLHVNSA